MRCSNCHNEFDNSLVACPICGINNPDYHTHTIETPRTIEELKIWYEEHGLPDERITRFFIGKNINEPKNFGIYYDEFSGNYVVYKNKDTGERKIRYEGKDEAFAVNEFWLRLKSEIQNQKSRQNKSPNKVFKPLMIFDAVVLIIFVSLFFIAAYKNRYNGYYQYNDNYYYCYSNDWYIYGSSGWTSTSSMNVIEENRDEYYLGSAYRDFYGISDFEDTSYYEHYHSSSSSSSSHYDSSDWSSSDSWDSSGTDWGSDW